MAAIYILWLRELKRYTRSRAQIVASVGQPLLYLVALGFGLGPIFRQAGQGSYLQFVAPGVIGMSILFTSVFSGIGLLWDRQFGFLKETLVAPVPRLHIMIGKTLGGATVAILQGLLIVIVCLIAGFRSAHLSDLPLALLFMILVALVFAALGMVIGSRLENMQGFQLIMNFLVMPIFFLSGALYPLNNLPRVMSAVTKMDPLTYGVDGLRSSLIGYSHFDLAFDAMVLVVVASVLMIVNSRPSFDTGHTREDVCSVLSYRPEVGLEMRQKFMPHCIAYSARNPEFGLAWRNMVMEPPRRELRHLLKLGIEKGELTADLDIENSLALLLGPILYWFIFFKGTEGKPTALAERVVDAFWRAFGVVGSRRGR